MFSQSTTGLPAIATTAYPIRCSEYSNYRSRFVRIRHPARSDTGSLPDV